MTHVRTQVRKAVIAKLAERFGEDHVGDAKFMFRDLQSHDFPAFLVSVSEAVSYTDKEPPGYRVQKRDFSVIVKYCIPAEREDMFDDIDALTLELERYLIDTTGLNVGKLSNWQLQGTSEPDIEPYGDDGLLVTNVTTFTCSMLTADARPDANIHN